ncbi:MAG: DUF1917 domain-containing protein [Anaerolineae bacterium]|nr:DUF1917 domain-containing protein [Anaerolineae bacterium]
MPDQIDPSKLDLIQMVQRARMQHDADALPSQTQINYWIEVKRQTEGSTPTANTGQWVLVCSLDQVDALWTTVKTATEQGKLGYKSKVAVISRQNPAGCVIYVRTYDADDLDDRARVYRALRDLGITNPLDYTNESDNTSTSGRSSE